MKREVIQLPIDKDNREFIKREKIYKEKVRRKERRGKNVKKREDIQN